MNRYQFENYISDYLDNTLSVAKRKEFESYIAENIEAKGLIDSLRRLQSQLQKLPVVKTSAGFTNRLKERITTEQVKIALQSVKKPTYFGFTPIVSGMISLVLIAIVFVGIDLLPDKASFPETFQSADIPTNNSLNTAVIDSGMNANPNFTLISDDSTFINDNDSNKSLQLEDKIQFVKNPQ